MEKLQCGKCGAVGESDSVLEHFESCSTPTHQSWEYELYIKNTDAQAAVEKAIEEERILLSREVEWMKIPLNEEKEEIDIKENYLIKNYNKALDEVLKLLKP